jgi:hypothetical protein
MHPKKTNSTKVASSTHVGRVHCRSIELVLQRLKLVGTESVVTNKIKQMAGVEEEGRATNVSGNKGEEAKGRGDVNWPACEGGGLPNGTAVVLAELSLSLFLVLASTLCGLRSGSEH